MNIVENHPTAILPFIFVREADGFTRITWRVVKVLSMAMIVFLPVAWLMRFVGAVLTPLTFGIYLIVYSIILWIPILGLLLGTSWLWLRCWPLRPVLVILGIPVALMAHLILMCAPSDRDTDAVLWKVSFTEDWPFSWKLRSVWMNWPHSWQKIIQEYGDDNWDAGA